MVLTCDKRSSIGDMTQPAHQSGMFQQFRLNTSAEQGHALETALDKPVKLNVGGDGIIGRRVSMLQQRSPRSPHPLQRLLQAEGIVGFNA